MASRQPLEPSPSELVAVVEAFYSRAAAGVLVFIGLAAAAAVAILPLRDSVSRVGWTTPTVVATGLLALLAPVTATRARAVLRLLRRRRSARIAVTILSAALLAYPLRSELWWPACSLMMLVGMSTAVPEALGLAAAVLVVNLTSHAIAGDLGRTPAVTILGLWIGFGFWPTAAVLFTDRIAAHLLRGGAVASPEAPRFAAPVESAPEQVSAHDTLLLPAVADGPEPIRGARRTARLTARQLEVVALLADGWRYDDVSAALAISTRQVQRHVRRAVERAGVENANQLVAVYLAER